MLQLPNDAAAASTVVVRPAPTPSNKMRNRKAYKDAGNPTEREQRRIEKGKCVQLSNLLPKRNAKKKKKPKRKASDNLTPGRSTPTAENDGAWSQCPPKRQALEAEVSSRSVATQTLKTPLLNVTQITHADLRALQGKLNASDNDMRTMANWMRDATYCPSIISPRYEATLPVVNREFVDLFKVTKSALVGSTPVVICTDVGKLLHAAHF